VIIILFFIIHWYLSLFSQTFFDHRYASHGAFTMSKFWERFFYIIAYITQGSSYLSPRAYAVMHRMHHAYTDTEKDPHSPKHFSNLFAMMWHTKNIYSGIFKRTIEPEKQFMKNVPDWAAFDRLAESRASKLIWIGIYTTFYILFASSPWLFLLLPITILMGPVHGVIINWYAHKYGTINFKMKNTSRNLFPVDLIMLGEGYHNDHHQYPSSANFGVKWYQVDPVYFIILLFQKFNMLKLVPQHHGISKKNSQ
jgi:stearoyl-CoA desaturase (delta-9 desaturase)